MAGGTFGSGTFGSGTLGDPSEDFAPDPGSSDGGSGSGVPAVRAPTIYSALHLQIGFGFRLDDDIADDDWTDVTAWLRWSDALGVSSGRTPDSLDQIGTGSGTIVLDNLDGRFNPRNADGPYYGQLLPRVPVRIALDVGGTLTTRWRGWVDRGWPQGWSDTDSTVTLAVLDAVGYLAQVQTPHTAFDDLVRRNLPTSWLRPGPDGWTDAVSGSTWPHTGSLAQGDPIVDGEDASWVSNEPGTGAAVGEADLSYAGDAFRFPPDPGGWAASGTFEVLDGTATGAPFVYIFDSTINGTQEGAVVAASDSFLNVGMFNTSTGELLETDPLEGQSFLDSGMHQITFARLAGSPDPVDYLWVDGVLYHPTTFTSSIPRAAAALPVRAGFSTLKSVAFGDVLVWAPANRDTAALLDTLAGLWEATRTAWAGDTMAERLSHVLASIGWQLVADLGTAGVVTRQSFRGGVALDLCQKIEDTEQGRIFVNHDGEVAFKPRAWAWSEATATTVQATFTDQAADLDEQAAAGPFPYLADALVMTDDDARLVNVAQVNSTYGRQQTVRDEASIAIYGERGKQLDGLLHPSDAQSRAIAEWLVANGAEPRTRIESLTIDALASRAAYEWATQVDEGHLIEVRRTPPGSAELTYQAHVAGLSHSFGPHGWFLTLHLDGSRAGQSWFTLDSSTLDGTAALTF